MSLLAAARVPGEGHLTYHPVRWSFIALVGVRRSGTVAAVRRPDQLD